MEPVSAMDDMDGDVEENVEDAKGEDEAKEDADERVEGLLEDVGEVEVPSL